MAFEPFQFTPYTNYSALTAGLSALGKGIGDYLGNRQDAQLGADISSALANGNTDLGELAKKVAPTNPLLAIKILEYKQAQDAKNTPTAAQQAQMDETHRHNLQIEGNYAMGKSTIVNKPDANGVLQPFVWDKSKGNGPDAFTPLTDSEGKRYRQMAPGDIDKITTQGNNITSLNDFTNQFKDEYGGFNTLGGTVDYGDFATKVGRRSDMLGTKEAAQWWQGYGRYKNVIRKELYGTALTPTEQQQFEAADITPGMDPGVIRHNLSIQKTIINRGAKRKADALIASGFSPQMVNSAYGLDATSLTDQAIPSPGQTNEPSGTPMDMGQDPTWEERQRQNAAKAIASGKDRAMVLKKLQDAGVSTDGL